MEIVRLQLKELTPTNQRYNTSGASPVFQTSNDGGTTWVNSPDADPRFSDTYQLPPLTPAANIPCDGAARLAAQLEDTLTIFLTSADQLQFAANLLGILVLPAGVLGVMINLGIFVGEKLIDIGQANISSAFTPAVWTDIKCIFSCYTHSDGTIPQGNLDQAYDDIKAAHPGVVATTIDELRLFYGDTLMTNAIISRTETGNCAACASCGWCAYWDFRVDAYDWLPRQSGANFFGGYVTGQGWQTALAGANNPQLQMYCPDTHGRTLTRIEFWFQSTPGGATRIFDFNPSTGGLVQVASIGAAAHGVWTGSRVFTRVLIVEANSGGSQADVGQKLQQVLIEGNADTNPFPSSTACP